MSITELRQKIEDNLANDLFILAGVDIANESVSQLLNDLPAPLQFSSSNSTVTSDGASLQVKQNKGSDWNVSGVTQGVIQEAAFLLTLTEGAAAVDAAVGVSGTFSIPSLNRSLPVTGSMSDPSSKVVDVEVGTDDLPTFADVAQSAGMEQVAQSFTEIKLDLPVVTAIRFGFDMQTKSFTFIAVDGTLRFGNGSLDVSCTFAPELTVSGSIPEDGGISLTDIFSTLGVNASNLPDSGISTLDFNFTPSTKTYSFAIGIENNWGVNIGSTTISVAKVGVDLAREADTTTAAISGDVVVDATAIDLSAVLDEEGSWSFNGELAEGSTIKLRSVINAFLPGAIELPNEVPDMGCKDIAVAFTPKSGAFSFKASSAEPWDIPIGVDGLSVSDIKLDLNRTKDESGKSQVTGLIAGTLNIGAASITAEYNIPGDFVLSGNISSLKLSPLVQDLCGMDSVTGMTVPASFLAVDLQDVTFYIAPQRGEAAFSAGSSFGKAEIQVKRLENGTWGFAAGFVPPDTWKFSTIDDSLKPLDGLSFAGTALILASNEDRSFDLATIETPREDVSIKRGLNLFASLSMKGLGVDELLKIDSLVVYAAISDPRNLVIEAQIQGEFKIDRNVGFGDIKFRLAIKPPSFEVSLLGTIHALVDQSQLDFIGELGIAIITTPPSFQANMAATMLGRWQDPMGAKGVAVMDVALDLGIAFPPIRPSIGIAGALQVGDFVGAAAVKFDTASPGNTMVAIAFNKLYLVDIFNAFCPPTVKKAIPSNIVKTVLDVGFEDVNIYVVPQPTTIGELYFEQGIGLKGTMYLWGVRAFASIKIDQTRGVLIEGDMDEINLGGILKLTGAGGKPKPSLYLDLRTGSTPTIDISGAVELFGLRSETILKVSDTEYYFFTEGKIFSLFTASLEVHGSSKTDGGSITVKATMHNELIDYLREKAVAEIKAAADEATRKISDAQHSIDAAQREVNKINNDIDNMRKTVRAERERDTANLKAAENAVADAQRKVDGINADIDRMRKTVQAERDRDTRNLNNARQAVINAQNDVNKLQGEIDSTKARINQLNADIASKRRWFDKSKWYEKSYRWAEFSAYAAAKGSEITTLYAKIGGIETAKHTALGVLELAKQTLRGMEAAAKTFPIDADPRLAALFTARETAKGALEVAKQTLRGLQLAAKTFPIDADPRIAALFAARETATGSLKLANLTLEGVKATVKAAASAAEFIAKFGLGGLLNIKDASFEGKLTATQGGRVSLALNLVFMNNPMAFAFAFNFNDPLSGAKDLAKKLLPS